MWSHRSYGEIIWSTQARKGQRMPQCNRYGPSKTSATTTLSLPLGYFPSLVMTWSKTTEARCRKNNRVGHGMDSARLSPVSPFQSNQEVTEVLNATPHDAPSCGFSINYRLYFPIFCMPTFTDTKSIVGLRKRYVFCSNQAPINPSKERGTDNL